MMNGDVNLVLRAVFICQLSGFILIAQCLRFRNISNIVLTRNRRIISLTPPYLLLFPPGQLPSVDENLRLMQRGKSWDYGWEECPKTKRWKSPWLFAGYICKFDTEHSNRLEYEALSRLIIVIKCKINRKKWITLIQLAYLINNKNNYCANNQKFPLASLSIFQRCINEGKNVKTLYIQL